MHPYHHPTTLLVLDDDSFYVESFKFHFGDQFPCVAYTQPERAIEHMLSQESGRPTFDDLLHRSATGAAIRQGRGDAGNIALDQVRKVMLDANRFRRVSVLVVDYDMPAMTGLQVCRALHHLPVKKLLLTGKAGLDTAIAAFNEGVIDTFLTKHDPEIQKTLPRQVLRLQEEYFKSTTETLGTALGRDETPFLADAGIRELVAGLMKSRNIVEHYVTARPGGIVMADQAGALMMLVAMDGDTLRAHWEVARDNGAPPELLELLSSLRTLPLFPTPSGFYEHALTATWSTHLYPAQRIDVDGIWHTALIGGEKAKHLIPPRMTTLAAFEEAQAAMASGQQAN